MIGTEDGQEADADISHSLLYISMYLCFYMYLICILFPARKNINNKLVLYRTQTKEAVVISIAEGKCAYSSDLHVIFTILVV